MNHYFMYLIVFLNCLLFFKIQYNIILILLDLELLISFIIWILYYNFMLLNLTYLILFFLVILIIEGILGLSLVVVLIRYMGNDYVGNLNMVW